MNPYLVGLRQHLANFLGAKYEKNQEIIERVGHSLITEKDFTAFISFMNDAYEVAYRKAMDDFKQHCEKLGIRVEIK